MFSYNYEIRYGDYKTFDTVKPSFVLDIIQDIAIRHSECCGYGLNKLRELNKAWLIKGIKLCFESGINTTMPITAYTAVKNMRGATSERGTVLKQNDIIVAKAITDWFLFDTELMKPARIPQEITSAYGLYDFGDDFFKFSKPELCDAKKQYSIRVFSKEIDTNNHLNNQKSAELLMDALPTDFNFKNMTVLYKKEAYLGQELVVCTAKTEKGYYVHLQTPENEICVAGVFE